MIEAVNTALQSAPVVRGSAERVSTVDSYAANPDQTQKAPQVPYMSPVVSQDSTYNAMVLQFRDAQTGEVVIQIPSRTVLASDQRDMSREAGQFLLPAKQESNAPEQASSAYAATAHQVAAFHTAAQAGATSGGNVSLFA